MSVRVRVSNPNDRSKVKGHQPFVHIQLSVRVRVRVNMYENSKLLHIICISIPGHMSLISFCASVFDDRCVVKSATP